MRTKLLTLLFVLMAIPAHAQQVSGPNSYANGFGLGIANVAYGVRASNPPCAEQVPCFDPDFPLAPGATSLMCGLLAPRYGGDTNHTVTGTCDTVMAGPNFMAAAHAIDASFAANAAAFACADSGIVTISQDDIWVYVPTSSGGRAWFGKRTATPPYSWSPQVELKGGSSFAGGSGCPTADHALPHMYYGYCQSFPGVCSMDPSIQNVSTPGVIISNTILNLNSIFASDPRWVNATGSGGEVDCTHDLTGAGRDSYCAFSIGAANETQDHWRYDGLFSMITGVIVVRDVKQDLLFYGCIPGLGVGCTGAGGTWPFGGTNCGTQGQTTAACTGVASGLNPATNPTCPAHTLVSCQGLHGLNIVLQPGNVPATRESLEGVGPTFWYPASATPLAVISSALNNQGHQADTGFNTTAMNVAGSNKAYVLSVLNCGVVVLPLCPTTVNNVINQLERLGSGVPGASADGHLGGQPIFGPNGMFGFESFTGGDVTLSACSVGSGTANCTCVQNPCWYNATAIPTAQLINTTFTGSNTTSSVVAGTGSDIPGSGTVWVNPHGVTGSASFANIVMPNSNQSSNPLLASNFPFTLPSGDTGVGVQVSLNTFVTTSVSGANTITAQLQKNGVLVGTAKTLTPTSIATVFTLGGASDTWGATFTTSDTIAVQFIATNNSIAGNRTYNIQNVQMQLTYALPANYLNGTQTLSPAFTGGNTFSFAISGTGTISAGPPTPLGQANTCGEPTNAGSNELAAYDPRGLTQPGHPTFNRVDRIWRSLNDACANNQNFQSLTGCNMSVDGLFAYCQTNHLSFYGVGLGGAITSVGVMVELIPVASSQPPVAPLYLLMSAHNLGPPTEGGSRLLGGKR